jgi:hypothetical protein
MFNRKIIKKIVLSAIFGFFIVSGIHAKGILESPEYKRAYKEEKQETAKMVIGMKVETSADALFLLFDSVPEETTGLNVSLEDITGTDFINNSGESRFFIGLSASSSVKNMIKTYQNISGDALKQIKLSRKLKIPFAKTGHRYQVIVLFTTNVTESGAGNSVSNRVYTAKTEFTADKGIYFNNEIILNKNETTVTLSSEPQLPANTEYAPGKYIWSVTVTGDFGLMSFPMQFNDNPSGSSLSWDYDRFMKEKFAALEGGGHSASITVFCNVIHDGIIWSIEIPKHKLTFFYDSGNEILTYRDIIFACLDTLGKPLPEGYEQHSADIYIKEISPWGFNILVADNGLVTESVIRKTYEADLYDYYAREAIGKTIFFYSVFDKEFTCEGFYKDATVYKINDSGYAVIIDPYIKDHILWCDIQLYKNEKFEKPEKHANLLLDKDEIATINLLIDLIGQPVNSIPDSFKPHADNSEQSGIYLKEEGICKYRIFAVDGFIVNASIQYNTNSFYTLFLCYDAVKDYFNKQFDFVDEARHYQYYRDCTIFKRKDGSYIILDKISESQVGFVDVDGNLSWELNFKVEFNNDANIKYRKR